MDGKQIEIKGIVRNTPYASSPDGELDEMLNLRHKDGSLRPINNDKEVSWTDAAVPDYLDDFSQIFIHNASNYKNMLGVADGKLYWFATMNTDYVATRRLSSLTDANKLLDVNESAVFFTQTGNLVCLVDGERFKYLLFKQSAQEYITLNVDLNGSDEAKELAPEGLIQLRVVNDEMPNGKAKIRYYRDNTPNADLTDGYRDCVGYNNDDIKIWDNNYEGLSPEYEEMIKANIRRALDKNRKDGRIDGWFLAVTALELYDGSEILVSRPILMKQANDEGTRYHREMWSDVGNGETNQKFTFDYQDKPMQLNAYMPLMTGKVENGSRQPFANAEKDKGEYNKEERYWDLPAYYTGGSGKNAMSVPNLPLGYKVVRTCAVGQVPIARIGYHECVMGSVPLCNYGEQTNDERIGYDGMDYYSRDTIELDSIPNLFALYGLYTWNYRGQEGYGEMIDGTGLHINGSDDLKINCGLAPNALDKSQDLIIPGYNDNKRGAGVVCSMANKLQFKVDGVYDKNYEDVIRSVNIYITEPVNSYDIDKPLKTAYFIPACLGNHQNLSNRNPFGVTAYPSHKTNAEIIKELEGRSTFYKVASIPYQNLAGQKEWVDVDLKTDAILQNIVQQERLTFDAFGRDTYKPKTAYSYNGKLHIANYNKYLFKGFPPRYFSVDFDVVNNVDVLPNDGTNKLTANGPQLVYDARSLSDSIATSATVSGLDKTHYSWLLETEGASQNSELRHYVNSAYISHSVNGVYYCGKFYYSLCKLSERDTTGHSVTINGTSVTVYDTPSCLSPNEVYYDKEYWQKEKYKVYSAQPTMVKPVGIEVTVDTQDGQITIHRADRQNIYLPFGGVLSYPDGRAKNMRVYYMLAGNIYYKDYPLKAHAYLPFAWYVSPDLKSIPFWYMESLEDATVVQTTPTWLQSPRDDQEIQPEYYPNGLKVSAVNNPFYFPAQSTYQVGNVEIVALCANTMALSTGQWGQHPLFVFCKDGIYAMNVDASGELTYKNVVPISREICNNARSVTPIDDAIVFTTDRGLLIMSGSRPTEISQTAEGQTYGWTSGSVNNLRGMWQTLNDDQLTKLLTKKTDTDFATYLKNVRIGYNYLERELWVSNPTKSYSYVFRQGQWHEITRSADMYIPDYPKTYRLKTTGGVGQLFDIGEEAADAVSGELSGADCWFVTRPIKLQTLGEKQSLRVSLRGHFKMLTRSITLGSTITLASRTARLLVYGSNDGLKWELVGLAQYPDVPTAEQIAAGKLKAYDSGNRTFTDLSCTTYPQQVKFLRVVFAGALDADSYINYLELQAVGVRDNKIR